MNSTLKSNFIKSLIVSYGSVIFSALIGFITVPLALNYFGKTLYGLFAITLDTLAYIALFNFGIPFVTATIFAKLTNRQEQKNLIKKALLILCSISLSLIILCILVYFLFPNWINFLSKVNPSTLVTAKIFIALNILFFTIKLPWSLYTQLLIFMNRMDMAKLVDILSTSFTFICLLIVIFLKLNMLDYAIINGLLSFIPTISSIVMFNSLWDNYPTQAQNSSTDPISYRKLTSTSFYYFINSIASLILWNTGSIVVSHYLGLSQVAEYVVLLKFFNILFMSITQLLYIISPLYPKLIKENRLTTLNNIFYLSNRSFPIIGGLLFILIFGCFKEFVILWTHNNTIFAGYLSCFAFGLYCYFLCSTLIPYFAILSLNESKTIYKLVLLEAIVSLVASVTLVQQIGIPGVIFGMLIGHMAAAFPFIPPKLDKLVPGLSSFDYKYVARHFLLAIVPTGVLVYFINHMQFSFTKSIFLLAVIIMYCVLSALVLGKDSRTQIIALISKRIKIKA
jgi:O-antigen/teichoic acid export membrane protein